MTADDPKLDIPTDDQRDNFSDDHPLASPTELAGSTDGALKAEFAARDAEEALDAADAQTDSETNSLPLDGE